MTITQALALRPGQRIVHIHQGDLLGYGRVVENKHRVTIVWDEGNIEVTFDHRYMHFIHILVETVTRVEYQR